MRFFRTYRIGFDFFHSVNSRYPTLIGFNIPRKFAASDILFSVVRTENFDTKLVVYET